MTSPNTQEVDSTDLSTEQSSLTIVEDTAPKTPFTDEIKEIFISLWTELKPCPEFIEDLTKAEQGRLLAEVAKFRKLELKNNEDLIKRNQIKQATEQQRQHGGGYRSPFKHLGYDSGTYYLISTNQLQVLALKASELSPNNLLQLADLQWWEEEYGIINEETGKVSRIDWPKGVNDIIQRCSKAGVYHPESIRGRGFWFDGEIALRHLGDRLINVNCDTEIPILDSSLKGVYQKSKAVNVPSVGIASKDQIITFFDTIKTIYWTNRTSPMLFMGWAAIAPMCGLLDWRPHIWITGEHGCGKSDTAIEALVVAIGKIQLLHAKDSTTEAGIRQKIKADAIPIILDEMEPNSAKDRGRIDRVISLARNASSDDEAVTLKGTISGDSSSFIMRSMFAYASINTHLPELADQSRTSVLGIEKKPQTEKSKEDFAFIKRNLLELEKSDFGYSLTNYMIKHIDTLMANISICVEAAGDVLGSARDGKQYGTLIAGYITMMKGEVISREIALEYIQKIDLSTAIEDDRDTTATGWSECWIKMANIRLELRDSNSRISISEALEMLQQNNLSALAKIAGLDTNNAPIEDEQTALKAVAEKGKHEVRLALRKLGIIYQDGTEALHGCTGEGIYLANKSELLKKALNGTAFEDWNQYSKRVGESTKSNINMANGRPRARFIKSQEINI